ncbi:DALR domain-containing protein, partial [Actinomyces sp.]|uniref:CysS/YqeB C-terminal domain-containing protein n=1 Tax=Actinomyces sp. TaxID=29317 RepID=UPI003622E4CF
KMSKSLGNSLVVAELLKRYDAAVLRLALGTVHHRSTVEFSEETLADAAALWERLSGAILRAYEFCDGGDANPVDAPAEQVRARALPAEFTAAMDEDLNLAGAMAVVHATLKALNVALTQAAPSGGQGADDDLRASVTGLALDLRAQLDVLGLDPLAEPWRARVLDGAGSSQGGAAMEALDRLIRHDLDERAQARAAKDWARADALRDKLTGAGVVVEDSPSGARWHLA